MRKDIEIPVIKDVHVAIVHEWNEDFLSKDWNAYIINNRSTAVETVLIVSKGYNEQKITSTMRHSLKVLPAKSYAKIELIQEEVLKLENEFYVTFFADNKLYERRFIFPKHSVNERNFQELPVMNIDGVLGK